MTALLAAVGSMTLMAGFMVMGTAGTAQAANDKTNVCHATDSDTNPYQFFSVGADGAGHVEHRGPDSTNDQEWHETTVWQGKTYLAGTPKFDLVEGYDADVPTDEEAAKTYCLAEGTVIGDTATAVAPTVVQSPSCDVEGTYTIPNTTGVQYKLDNVNIAAGTYNGPKTGTVTAVALQGFTLTNPGFSYALSVAPAADCPTPPPPPPPTDVCTNIPGDQATVPVGWTEKDGICSPIIPPPPVTDICTNIEGIQSEVPEGYSLVDGLCEKDEIAPAETEKPKPTPKPTTRPPVVGPAEVAGTAAAVPTAVAAGLRGPAGTSTSPGSPLGQGLVAGGLLMLMLAGAMQLGRRERGAHEV